MEKEKLTNLTTKQLQIRKKFVIILLAMLITAVVIDGSVLIYKYIIGKGFSNALFIAVTAGIVIFIPIYIGKKQLEGELNQRKDI